MAAQEQKTLKIDVKTPAGKVDGVIELPVELRRRPGQHRADAPGGHRPAGGTPGYPLTKTRGEVSGGGRKPHRQKGTVVPGRARRGRRSHRRWRGTRSKPRDYSQRTPKKTTSRRCARCPTGPGNGRIHAITGASGSQNPSTKSARAFGQPDRT